MEEGEALRMTHDHTAPPRWLWPLSAVLFVVIILLSIFAPVTTAPPAAAQDHAHVDHEGHGH